MNCNRTSSEVTGGSRVILTSGSAFSFTSATVRKPRVATTYSAFPLGTDLNLEVLEVMIGPVGKRSERHLPDEEFTTQTEPHTPGVDMQGCETLSGTPAGNVQAVAGSPSTITMEPRVSGKVAQVGSDPPAPAQQSRGDVLVLVEEVGLQRTGAQRVRLDSVVPERWPPGDFLDIDAETAKAVPFHRGERGSDAVDDHPRTPADVDGKNGSYKQKNRHCFRERLPRYRRFIPSLIQDLQTILRTSLPCGALSALAGSPERCLIFLIHQHRQPGEIS